MSKPKILLLDIETSPHTVFVWDLKPYYISPDQMIKQGGVLCFAAKWLGSKEMLYWSAQKGKRDHERMVKAAHKLLSAADGVIHYNGTKFDIPMLHREMAELGLTPPLLPMEHDLLTTVKRRFRFPSNKLSYVAGRLKLGKKLAHKGLELWIKCMAGDADAWKVMERYNKQDVLLTEKLYLRLRPWITRHLNTALFHEGKELRCPRCSSTNIAKWGKTPKGGHMYHRFLCRECGYWPKERVSASPVVRRGKGTLV